jgi:aspartyl-tRNA(Asn)/glutamyl-tRNA(Gln) amidotransferase subunit B
MKQPTRNPKSPAVSPTPPEAAESPMTDSPAGGLPYRIIAGLEIHVELNTQTKMFCRCLNDPFHAEPNTNICPVCCGLPGTLPVPNREAVRKCLLMGKALGSTFAPLSKWDRKHYFYPDLPKGYQISQYDLPLCLGGQVELLGEEGQTESAIRLERIHLEEDAGKLLHAGKPGFTHVDLNRAGVPLIEMVTKPDLVSAEQARRLLQELRLLARTLGISDADMEKGQMRCDVNVNIAFTDEDGQAVKTPITEVKNVNSTRAVERSITTEAQRQYEEWRANGPIRHRKNKITAGWDEDTGSVLIQRAKEAANDYRYFPEPDIPPIRVYEASDLNPDNLAAPELPNVRRRRYAALGLAKADVEVLLSDPTRLARLEALLAYPDPARPTLPAKLVVNWLLNAPASAMLPDAVFAELAGLVQEGRAGFAAVKPLLEELAATVREKETAKTAADPAVLVVDFLKQNGLIQEHDDSVVQWAIEEVLREQPEAVAQVREGNVKVFGFLVGQVLKKTAGKAQPQRAQAALREALNLPTA